MILWVLLALPFFAFAVPDAPGREVKRPFVTGDAFRSLCDYCYDEVDKSFDPVLVEPRSAIFVKTDFLEEFFTLVHPKIPFPYILIAHNSDDSTPGKFYPYLDDGKLIVWFGQNFDGYSHPKMIPIPMGIANSCWPHGNCALLERAIQEKKDKSYLAHMQFTIQTFPEERLGVYRKFSSEKYCYNAPKKSFFLYLSDISAAKFEIAPRGHALDTHRIWESIYLGTIPVVKTSPLDGLYSDLPVLIIQDWSQVTKGFLKMKYAEFSNRRFNLEKMDIGYWSQLIDSYKR